MLYETLNTMGLESVDNSDRFMRFLKPICFLQVSFKLIVRMKSFEGCENLGVRDLLCTVRNVLKFH